MHTEVSITNRFYKKHTIEELMTLTEAQIDEKINVYLDNYIKGFEARYPGQDLPNLSKSLDFARNKRTNASKKPIIIRRKAKWVWMN